MKTFTKIAYLFTLVFSILFAQQSLASLHGDDIADLAPHLVRIEEAACSSIQAPEICCFSNCSWNETEGKCSLSEDKRKEIYSRSLLGSLKLQMGLFVTIGVLYGIVYFCLPNLAPIPTPAAAA